MKYARCYISPAEKKKSGGAYDKWNISVVTQIFRYDSPSHGGGRNTFDVMTLP
jgi:hypothetical protein